MAGAGRRNRRRRPPRAEVPVPVVNPQPVDGGDDWPQSDVRAMKRDLLRLIHRYYLDAISRLPHAELNNKATLARALLVGGHCFGPLGPVHNIIVNSIWYAAAAATDGDGGEEERPGTVLSTDGIARVCHRSLQGLVASLRRHCPSLRSSSTGDALHHLMNADADLTAAVALASGTSASSAKQAMVSRNLAAFRLAAEAAGHPDPAAFARFASSALPAANARHDIFQFLLVNRALSAGDIRHLSTLLAPPAALPSEEPPRPPHPLALRPEVSPQKQQVSDTGRQVIRVVDMAAQHYTSQTGVQLALHSVCGVCLLKEQELLDNCCYHINFLAHRRDSTSALGFPVLLFTEAVALAHDDIDVKLCVIVDPATEIARCFACEANKKMIVHPTYDDYYLSSRNFEEDEVDCESDFPEPLDADCMFFDAERDRDVVKYLDDRTGSDGIGSS